jgi:RimJ/RimL family protein N-acetyltransferase
VFGTISLETERLILDPWQEDRREEFVSLASDPEVMRHIGAGSPWTRELAEDRFDWQLAHWRDHGFGWRSAVDRSSGDWLGFVGINHARPEAVELNPGDVEIGWWLAPSSWGRGLATEGAVALRDEGVGRVALPRLLARHSPANRASGRVMEKIGMTFEREATGRHGEAVHVWAMERARWEALR